MRERVNTSTSVFQTVSFMPTPSCRRKNRFLCKVRRGLSGTGSTMNLAPVSLFMLVLICLPQTSGDAERTDVKQEMKSMTKRVTSLQESVHTMQNVIRDMIEDSEVPCPVKEGYIKARGLSVCYKIHHSRQVSREAATATCQLEEATLVNLDSEEKVRQLQYTLIHDYVCPTKDWVKFRDSCYQFFPRGREQYAGTFKQCRKIGACAVGIQTAEEDAFLQAYIQRCCSGVPKWRTGGMPRQKTWAGKPRTPFNFTNWWPGTSAYYQTYYPTLVLVWHNSSRSYKWRGDWHYSVYQYPAGAYPFICERKAETSNAMMKYTVQTPGGGCKALDGQRNFTLTDVPCDDKLDGFVCEKNA
ncbi:hypothetical protein BaRGS_00022123 [Batillaria attramentaria]|uniref:C-type lectin domain-containing protein n=1 Tax=Batillaria attramentaria TaxID=370345 RepID=A0ABD0KHQ1_9CAEN